MARIWHCPKCSNQIVITFMMEEFPFKCTNCNTVWGREDMEHFALGLSEFDVADVEDYLKERQLKDSYKMRITKREQILLVAIENALNYAKVNDLAPLIIIAEMAIRDFGRAVGPMAAESQDWCEAEWQEERRQDFQRHNK